MKKVTFKQYRKNINYVHILLHGNAKLKDEKATEEHRAIKYMQYNLPALRTCPYASIDCKKFCYAKRDERYITVKDSREKAFKNSLDNNFVNRMVYTVAVELKSRRYKDAFTLFRLHESGDFYNQEYFNKWIDIIYHFKDKAEKINFHAYTKCFVYILGLDDEHAKKLDELLNRNVFTLNLSIDASTTPEQLARVAEIKRRYPKINTYTALLKVDEKAFNHICDCANCGLCRACSTADGKNTAVVIH